MKSKKILFIDTVHSALQEQLELVGMNCVDGSEWTESEIRDKIQEYNGVVIRSRFKLDKTFLEKAINLEFIARAGAGMENIDYPIATTLGIHCINAPEGNRNAVAEHALGMLLSLFNNLSRAHKEVSEGLWRREENRGIELDGKKVGIIGFGNTGKAFAKKLKGFEVEIFACDPYVIIDPQQFPEVRQTGLEEIYRNCNVVSFHVPLTTETMFMGDKKFFSSFTNSFYLINTSRGKVVKTDDLVKAIVEGKIKGAALDVLEFETISFENLSNTDLPEMVRKLIESDKVLLSPHVAGWTFESHRKISEVLAEKILNFYTPK